MKLAITLVSPTQQPGVAGAVPGASAPAPGPGPANGLPGTANPGAGPGAIQLALTLLLIVALAISTSADAQLMQTFVGPGSPNQAAGVACGPGQLDFSDACNTTLYLVILR